MPLGCGNSIPMQVGGSPTRFEKSYSALQRMVGRNGYSTDENEIEAVWRQAKADAMACLESFDERAALQVSPLTATDHIPLFESMLGIVSDPSLPDQDRRDVIVPDYTGIPEAWSYALTVGLQRIDSSAGVIQRAWETSSTTMTGRWYEPFNPDPQDTYDQNGDRRATAYPNYSDSHEVIIEYAIGNGSAPSKEQRVKANQMLDYANEVCPAWVGKRLIYASGFILDLSCLDITGFGT